MPIKERSCSLEAKFVFKWKGKAIKESKQEVAKIFPFVTMEETPGGVLIHLKKTEKQEFQFSITTTFLA